MDNNPAGRPMEILLVEDHLEDARVTIEALTVGSIPCRVSLVLNGEEAMRFLHREGVFLTPPCLLEWQYHAQPRSRMVSARHFADSVARCLLT